jgi:hypothetical protein
MDLVGRTVVGRVEKMMASFYMERWEKEGMVLWRSKIPLFVQYSELFEDTINFDMLTVMSLLAGMY